MPIFDEPDNLPKALYMSNEFLRSEYLVLKKDCMNNRDDMDYVMDICYKLQKINEILLMANAHVGYRVRDEIVFYMLNNKHADNLLSEEEALDYEIMQKILPRIQGSSEKIRDMLVKLFCYCVDEDPDHTHGLEKNSGPTGSDMLRKVDEGTGIKYPVSAKKIGFMMMRYEEDGFTSY